MWLATFEVESVVAIGEPASAAEGSTAVGKRAVACVEWTSVE